MCLFKVSPKLGLLTLNFLGWLINLIKFTKKTINEVNFKIILNLREKFNQSLNKLLN